MHVRYLVLAAAGMLLAGCFPMGGGEKQQRYLTEKAAVGDLEKTVLATGSLQPLDIVNVGAQATGQIQSLKVQMGDVVKRGQLIAVIDPQNQQNTLRNAEAALALQKAQRASQQAQLEQNELSYNRQVSLVKTGAAAQAALDQANAALKVSRANLAASDAQIRQAEIQVEKAKVDLSRTQVIAPIDGVVAAIEVREGQTVNAVQSAPTIVRLANMSVMTVKAQVSEADVINVSPGQKVYFTILGDPERRYYGTVRTVEPAPESTGSTLGSSASSGLGGGSNTAVYYNALFDVPNSDGRLKAAMTAQVNVVLAETKNVLTIPSAALGAKEKDGRYAVKVLAKDGKTTEERKVAVGLNNNVKVQVLGGLKAGEEVVVGDAFGVKATPGRQGGGGQVSVRAG